MKAISMWQPWAWAVFHGKDIENRSWKTKYRGPLFIHAAKGRYDLDGAIWIHNNFPKIDSMMPLRSDFSYGCLIGRVDFVDCVTESDSPWFFGPYGHVYKNPIGFRYPIHWKGGQGFFEVPDYALEVVLKK